MRTRAPWTNSDETTFAGARPIMAEGIASFVTWGSFFGPGLNGLIRGLGLFASISTSRRNDVTVALAAWKDASGQARRLQP
jgi:hypothetical protein